MLPLTSIGMCMYMHTHTHTHTERERKREREREREREKRTLLPIICFPYFLGTQFLDEF